MGGGKVEEGGGGGLVWFGGLGSCVLSFSFTFLFCSDSQFFLFYFFVCGVLVLFFVIGIPLFRL